MAKKLQPPTFNLGNSGYQVVRTPPVACAIGSLRTHSKQFDAPPRMFSIPAASVGTAPVTNKLFQDVMGKTDSEKGGEDHPVTQVSYQEALEFCRRFKGLFGVPVRLPHECEFEAWARETVDIRLLMEEKNLKNAYDLRDYLEAEGDPLENFIGVDPLKNRLEALELGLNICTGIQDPRFQTLIHGTSDSIFAWRGFPSFCKGEPNSFGLSHMSGTIWQICSNSYGLDSYLVASATPPFEASSRQKPKGFRPATRGGKSPHVEDEKPLLSSRNWLPDEKTGMSDTGFRIVAPLLLRVR